MPQPAPYARDFDFTNLAPAEVPEVGARLNAEFDDLAARVSEIRDSLGRIQRDDGVLANQSVHPDALSARTRSLVVGGWSLRGNWTTATAYVARDVVAQGGVLYVALATHVSGVFATDLAAGRWLVWYQENTMPGPATITPAMLAPSFELPFNRLGVYRSASADAVPRSIVYRIEEEVSLGDFGVDADGGAPIDGAWVAAVAHAEQLRAVLVVPPGTYRASGTLTFRAQNARGIRMDGHIVLDAGFPGPALAIGQDSATPGAFNRGKRYVGLSVSRAAQSNWSDESVVGIQIINADNCDVHVARAEGFTIGVQLVGSQRGCEDSRYTLGRLVNNRIGLDLRCTSASGWVNANTFVGGQFANDSGTNPLLNRFGVRLSFTPGSYNRHNANRFFGPSFELQRQGTPGSVAAIPFLVEADDARDLHATSVRMEACSPFVARHTGGAQGGALDCVYEVGYVGTYGYSGADVEYVGATRFGGSVRVAHQAAVAFDTPRLVAAVNDVRAAAFRNAVVAAGGIGFEGLAVLSGNPAGPPTNLTGFAFGGLDLITLAAGHVGLPTSRALAFVVDCGECKDFLLAAEGTDLRLVVMQFDASENVLGAAAPVRLSNGNIAWTGIANNWWEMSSNLDALTGGVSLNRHQRVSLHASARFAMIGVRGGSASAIVRAMRLFAPARFAPAVLAGGARAWGTREIQMSQAWTVPSLSPNTLTPLDVALPGLRGGDYLEVSFEKTTGFQNGNVVFEVSHGGTAATDAARVIARNSTGSTVNVGDGIVRVRAIRPRL